MNYHHRVPYTQPDLDFGVLFEAILLYLIEEAIHLGNPYRNIWLC
jgi:hypothetical protein